ncbi:hypothetical protein Tco_1496127, partial [Tanacetum coccineum]
MGPSRRRYGGKAEDPSSYASYKREFLGGDLALTAFPELSIDLSLDFLGHAFACGGSLVKLSENSFRDLSFQKYRDGGTHFEALL